MLSKIHTAGLLGINAFHVCCETDIGDGLPGIILIGSLSGEVKEAADRVKTAIKNSKYSFYPRKIVINLSPAEIKKEGCGYDLPIAISILEALGTVKSNILNKSLFVGELSLSGELLPIRGILPIVMFAKENGFENVFLPYDNLAEANIVTGIKNFGIKNLKDLIEILNGEKTYSENIQIQIPETKEYSDFSDVNGQILLKRAVQIAVAGRHNILFIGPAGTGKSMIAKRIPGIMPNMSDEEALEVSKIYSVCGLLSSKEPILKIRPYRSPHHTVSPQALSGGGRVPKPGEISLAHKGVLFLDELAEFKTNTIEVLRQPMENKTVSIARVNASIDYPADFMLVAATNPCKCGYYPDRSKCSCNEAQVKKYLSRISYLMSKTITPRFSSFEFFMSRLIDRNQRAEFIEEVEFFLLGLKTGISELFIASTYHFSFIIFSDIFISLFLSLDTMLPFFPITVILLIPLLYSRIE